jgi:putative hydrolase of the HAD superfamily
MRADIQAVIFDLDDTLLDRRRSFERFLRDQWERFAHCLGTADQAQYVQALVELDRDGYAPRQSLFTGVVTRFKPPSGVADDLLNDCRSGFPNACVLFPDAAQTLSCLRTSGLKLGMITNGSVRMQSRKLQWQAVFVGDHPEVDVAGARAAGMHAIWRRGRGVSRLVETDGVIDELGDLLTWLGLEGPGLSN